MARLLPSIPDKAEERHGTNSVTRRAGETGHNNVRGCGADGAFSQHCKQSDDFAYPGSTFARDSIVQNGGDAA
eukprot:scaffold131855_cov27-Prasinocladus_malaysianus.AAC.1